MAGSCAPFATTPWRAPLPTPSGRIEITSATIAGFGYADCPAHPTWLPPTDGAGSPAAAHFPLQLDRQPAGDPVAQPTRFRRHQPGLEDRRARAGAPPPAGCGGARHRDGDIVRLYNDRGACLAGAVLSEALRPGVVQLSTGAWYDPDDPAADQPLCVHGNPNVLTRDLGTSPLAQGCTGQLTLVEIERFDGPLPPIKAYDPPPGAS